MDYCTLNAKTYLSKYKIVSMIKEAVEKETPLSLVRIGDGENIVMAQEKVLSLEWISKNVAWRNDHNYCGIVLPNLEARDRCMQAVRNADLVGVFAGDKLTERIFKAFKITPKNIFYAFENVYLPMYKPFVRLIRDHPPLLVGRPAKSFAKYLFEKLKIRVPGTVLVDSYEDIDTCIKNMVNIPHKWSLISAGVNALIIANEMATKHGKVAIDFGHAPDNVMSPVYKDYWLANPDD